jgi:hypothetical protein
MGPEAGHSPLVKSPQIPQTLGLTTARRFGTPSQSQSQSQSQVQFAVEKEFAVSASFRCRSNPARGVQIPPARLCVICGKQLSLRRFAWSRT